MRWKYRNVLNSSDIGALNNEFCKIKKKGPQKTTDLIGDVYPDSHDSLQ